MRKIYRQNIFRNFRIATIALGLFMLYACSTDEMAEENSLSSDETIEDMMEEVESGVLTGSFINQGGYQTSGMVSVDEERTEISFNDFSTENGPALEVWLATEVNPQTEEDYISLGELQELTGDFSYELPENINYAEFNQVLIWCVEFAAPFGSARIQ